MKYFNEATMTGSVDSLHRLDEGSRLYLAVITCNFKDGETAGRHPTLTEMLIDTVFQYTAVFVAEDL